MSAKKVSPRLIVLIVLAALFMIGEFVVGYLQNSLALVSDSFHMLSDVLALGVALWARRFSKKDKTETMTYGWRRAEVVGALANGVFLLALCLNIVIEAIQRFFDISEVKNPIWLIVVGGIGLIINIFGLFLVGGHAHGHSHGHGHRSDSEVSIITPKLAKTMSQEELVEAPEPPSLMQEHSHANMNMKGIFLHVLGDALGSMGVIVSGLVIWLTSFDQRYYIDPIISIFITAIILKTTIPLVRKAGAILLQAVPNSIDVKKIGEELAKVDDVLDIHEIHIWQLSNDLLVASLHITCLRSCNFMKLASTMKGILHSYGIHATTIQPELVDENYTKGEDCLLRCQTKCVEVSCCTQRSKGGKFENSIEPS